MADELKPKDHAEATAIFRAQLLGPVLCRDLVRGELYPELKELSRVRVRPPGAPRTRRYAVPTLKRWYYAYRRRGLEGLKPRPRKDRGHGRELTKKQRELLCDIRRKFPRASAKLILRTVVAEGHIEKDTVKPATVNRLYRETGLDRQTLGVERQRRRWQAEHPNALWHADVCHGPPLVIGDKKVPLRIHAILDDYSRHIVAIEAFHTEREADMLKLLIKALRRWGAPDCLYLDNGSTYRGETLEIACARLGSTLKHAQPYDPQARGKMERWWRTLREGCVDYLGDLSSLHDVQLRLLAFVDQHYHVAPHAGLMGRTPDSAYADDRAARQADDLTEDKLREALTVRVNRTVRKDGTIPVGGVDWEVEQGFLAGRKVTLARTLVDDAPPWLELQGRRLELGLLDPVKNARRRRKHPPLKSKTGIDIPFDPPKTLLDQLLRRPKGGDR
ncbi:MAG: DDE-type integrase/transposase/recombinase [bacterium]